jgi:hypothetical protein
MATIHAFDRHVEQLFDVIRRVAAALASARIEYRIVGGVAVFLHVHERDALAARSTRDVDIAVDRRDLARIAEAARPHGFEYRQAAGVDMLVDLKQPKARSAVHLIFVGERVRAEYVEAVPLFSPPVPTKEGVLVAPVADIVTMKLTSFRLRDRVHLKDLDAVELITPEIEAALSPALRARLQTVRSEE